MISHLEEFFKNTPLGIKSVLEGSVHLAEKVNSRTDLSGKEKTELVVKTLVEFLGEGRPELVALVEAVVPGVLELVISTARGKYMLKQAKSCVTSCVYSCVPSCMHSCLPSCLTSSATAITLASKLGCLPSKADPSPPSSDAKAAEPPSSEPKADPSPPSSEPTSDALGTRGGVWAWVRSPFFRPASSATPVSPVCPVAETSPVVTIRDASPATA